MLVRAALLLGAPALASAGAEDLQQASVIHSLSKRISEEQSIRILSGAADPIDF